MTFAKWWESYVTRTLLSFPWARDVAKDAFKAGRTSEAEYITAYEGALDQFAKALEDAIANPALATAPSIIKQYADRLRAAEAARPEVKDTAWKAAMEERQWFEDKCKEHRATIRALAERCRPAVAHDARLREREVRSDKYAPHYKPALQAEAEKAGKLLDEIDALLSDSSPLDAQFKETK